MLITETSFLFYLKRYKQLWKHNLLFGFVRVARSPLDGAWLLQDQWSTLEILCSTKYARMSTTLHCQARTLRAGSGAVSDFVRETFYLSGIRDLAIRESFAMGY